MHGDVTRTESSQEKEGVQPHPGKEEAAQGISLLLLYVAVFTRT